MGLPVKEVRAHRRFADEANRFDAKRERLVRCARKLAERGDASRVSVTDVSTEMGITRGLFYYYFGSKNELNQAIADAYAQDLLDAINKQIDEDEACDREAAIQVIVDKTHEWLYDGSLQKRPMWHVLEEMELWDYVWELASNDIANLIIDGGLLAKYGKIDDEMLYEHARFVSMGILGECGLRPNVSLSRVKESACAALRYRKRRSA
ncbi:MAG: TetR/AcrR family transcriptional regulator [Atopobiaceae bacterium]|nr:TetR/AcrR family transcriptional regulator [Atopobiaceae bacterium]